MPVPTQEKPVAPPAVSFDDTSIAFSAKSNAELRKMYLLFASMNSNFLVNTGTAFLKFAFNVRFPLVKNAVKHTLFEHFCGGETIAECEHTIKELARFGIGTILDYSVEGEKSETGFESTTREILATIEKAATNSKDIPFCVFKITGLADAELLTKVQAETELTQPEKTAFTKVQERVDRICSRAHQHNVRIFIDGEETWMQETIDELAHAMMTKYNRERAIVYNTYQHYRVAALPNLKRDLATAESEGYYLGAKLVRGAYMEKERREAQAAGRPDPIQPTKEATDHDFDEALRFCLQHHDRIALCAGTHNEESNYLLIQLMHEQGLPANDPDIYFAQLYGMSDNLSYNLAHAGYNVAKYVPYGPIEAVMPYLFRRATENTAIAGQSSREFTLIQREMKRRKAVKK